MQIIYQCFKWWKHYFRILS